MLLAKRHPHPLDSHIIFEEQGHIYIVDGDSNYTSVTTWIHQFFPKFDPDEAIAKMKQGRAWGVGHRWWGLSDDEIRKSWKDAGKEAALLGTQMHHNIELYFNEEAISPEFQTSAEWSLFQQFLGQTEGWIPFRTEWTIFWRDYRLAGSIDMVYYDPTVSPPDPERLILVDWKRSKELKYNNRWASGSGVLASIDDCNFWHYTLQLNVYRAILQANYGKTVTAMYLVVLHPSQENCLKVQVPINDDIIQKMLLDRQSKLH